MRRRVTLRDCIGRAQMIGHLYGIRLYVDTDARRPRLMVGDGKKFQERWREAIPPLQTSQFLMALHAFEQGAMAAVHKETEP